MRKLIFGLSFSIALGGASNLASQALAKEDTALYIFFDRGNKPREIRYSVTLFDNGTFTKHERSDSIFSPELNKKILRPDSYSIDAFNFIGKTKDLYNRMSTIIVTLRELKQYKVVAWSDVLAFVKANYKERRVEEYAPDEVNSSHPPRDPLGSVSFWNNIKHIYMVEVDKKRKIATLTEVTMVAY